MATVWILGAGFSKPLGGPLLPQLFAPGSDLKVRTSFPEYRQLYESPEARIVRAIYEDAAGLKQWEDAEEYLDYLDTARSGGRDAPAHKALTELVAKTGVVEIVSDEIIRGVALMGRRLLVAECSAFLVGADVNAEKWQPYRRWAEKVERGDTVITFNYDLVLEKLARATEASPGSKFRILPTVPRQGPDDQSVTILKLHGSANWRKDEQPSVPGVDKLSVVHDREFFALECDERNMVIASPGPSKFAASAGGTLGPLWEAATYALKMANAIVFVGYRFPPTDSAARRILIEAIGDNARDQLALHTVLGPDVRGEAIRRLASLLEVATRKKGRWDPNAPRGPPAGRAVYWYELNVHPLWGQDFLDFYEPGSLYRQQ